MGSYRVEVASSGRAGCNGPACKKNKVKILKGEIRLGVWVETEKYQSWSWRHWGCVTPKVISNIGDSIDENGSPNFDVLDGLDELPEESQDKIKRAVKEGEVPVEDRTVVADNETTAATEEPAKATKASKAKKRSRADGEDADETAPKKSGKSTGKAAAAAEEETSEGKPTKATKASKTNKRARADSEEAAEVAPKKARKSTGKAAAAETENGAGSGDEEADEVPSKKPRKSTGKAVVEKETSEEKPARRGRSRKAAEEPVEKVAEPKKTAGRKRKASVTEEEGADNAEPEAKPAARKTRKSEATNGEKAKRGRPKRA